MEDVADGTDCGITDKVKSEGLLRYSWSADSNSIDSCDNNTKCNIFSQDR